MAAAVGTPAGNGGKLRALDDVIDQLRCNVDHSRNENMRADRPRRHPLPLHTTRILAVDERTNLLDTACACRHLPDNHRHPRHRRPPTHALGWLQQVDITYWGDFDAVDFTVLDAEEMRAFRFLFNQGRLRIEQEQVLFVYANTDIREPESFGPATHKKTLTDQ